MQLLFSPELNETLKPDDGTLSRDRQANVLAPEEEHQHNLDRRYKCLTVESYLDRLRLLEARMTTSPERRTWYETPFWLMRQIIDWGHKDCQSGGCGL